VINVKEAQLDPEKVGRLTAPLGTGVPFTMEMYPSRSAERPNNGMQLTRLVQIGASQLIPSVRRT
jgi:hypothetical protein